MTERLSISQLNKIGERLRKNTASDEDLKLLDTFRLSFTPAYEKVFDELSKLRLNPGGRPHKTTLSIIAKLNREKTRLSKMQDIAGCRVEVDNLIEQDRIVNELKMKFPGASVQDRRIRPSYGYRAVHLVVVVDDHPVEIQVRTSLQHTWASAAEKISDLVDLQIKYGGGPEHIRRSLDHLSGIIERFESTEMRYLRLAPVVETHRIQERQEIKTEMLRLKAELKNSCDRLIMNDAEGNWQ